MSDKNQYFLTTAINYTNGKPHLGHAYEAIVSDILSRYYRNCDYDVCFCTGTDEHGQKIAETAERENKTPKELCDMYVSLFQELNDKLSISNDLFIRTTDPHHEEFCQWLWNVVAEKGDIFLGEYEGWYNIKEEAYVTETEAKEKDYKDDAGNPLTKTKEASYFFRMSKYQEALIDHIKNNPEFILPEVRRNEILSRLEDPLLDLSVSRTTFDWGIPVPNDDKHVMYVWFDALSNYLSAIHFNEEDNELNRFWPANVQIIGKDIVWFHTVIWPCMLLSAEIPLPKTVYCHGFINDEEGKKMSKSVGNVVDPNDILQKYNSDVVRFYLAKGILGQDIPFSEQALIIYHDAELANGYGNLVSRAFNLPQKWYDGLIPDFAPIEFYDLETLNADVKAFFDKFEIQNALERILEFLRETNNWLAHQAPWKMKDDQLELRGQVVRTIIEAVYVISHYLEPFLPNAARIVVEQTLNVGFVPLSNLSWHNLESGSPIAQSDVLFARLGENRFDKKKKQPKKPKRNDEPSFADLEIRVGKVLSVEIHPDADALYVEQIDLGEESGPRTVISGLRKFYEIDEFVGRDVAVIMNLPAKKTRGIVSQGMVYCASNPEHTVVELIPVPEGSVPGDRIIIEGVEDEPLGNVNAKRYSKISSGLFTTNAEGFATCGGKVWMTEKGILPPSTIQNGTVA